MRSNIKGDEVEGDMTAMIDVVFLLLIFFMCAAKFKTLEDLLNAHLPDIGEQTETDIALTPLRIELKADTLSAVDGRPEAVNIRVRVGSIEVGQYRNPISAATQQEWQSLIAARKKVFDDLYVFLEAWKKKQNSVDENPVSIAPDLRISAEDVIQAVDMLLKAQIHEFSFAGKVSDVAKLMEQDGLD